MTSALPPLALFISYSHKDDEWRAKLDSHLALLKRQKVFDVWHDRRIGAGQEWAGQIDDAMERASVMLLLVSSDFLASDYCYDKEMKRALQRHAQDTARVVPVILRKCDWHSSDFGKLQAVPRDGRPIASYPDVDEAMTEVALALRKVAEEMRGGSAPPPSAPVAAASPPAVDPGAAQTVQRLANEGRPLRDATQPEPVPTQREMAPHPRPARKFKIGAIKLWFLEVGPFELEWPAHLGAVRVAVGLAATVAALVIAASTAYVLLLKPPLDEARNLMRRAEYSGAATVLDALPRWAAALPGVKGLTAQAAFGSRLAGGEHIRSLSPSLDALGKLYPQAPDVLVFQGLKAYYVDANAEQAIRQFTLASDLDEAHVEAHFLGAGRHVNLAYAALGQGDEPGARAAAAEARRLIDRSVERSPFARTLPRYANQMAELQEFEGDSSAAQDAYARLAPQHALSAVQSAVLSWRLPETSPALRNALEAVEAAILRVEREAEDAVAVEGWSFRVAATDVKTDIVDIRSRNEKLCLLEWVQAVSKSLLLHQERNTAMASPTTNATSARCGNGAIAQRIVEVVCVEAITAQDRLPPGDRRRDVLEDWRAKRLSCAAGLQPMPVLPASAGSAKPTALHTAPRAESEVGDA